MKRLYILWGLLGCIYMVHGQSFHPDSARQALTYLKDSQQTLNARNGLPSYNDIDQAIEWGEWNLASQWMDDVDVNADSLKVLSAKMLRLQHKYAKGYLEIKSLLERQEARNYSLKDKIPAFMLYAKYLIDAWELDKAKNIYLEVLTQYPEHEESLIGLGYIALYQKSYKKALARAEQVIQWKPDYAEAYALAAEAYFWLRDEKNAEKLLIECLNRDPWNADARFAYGYAIWRRRDINQLPQMADQWELALALNPLHYRTHWHWGNGHTHLTFTDYVEEKEHAIREELNTIDSLNQEGDQQVSADFLNTIVEKYPESRFPLLYLGSHLYQRTDLPNLSHLDQSQEVFLRLLQKFPHYGPAHNGLAAVIKKQQFDFLTANDSLEEVIQSVQIPAVEGEVFYRVFPDLQRYPGNRVEQMVWQQLYTTKVYLPMLDMLGRKFAIPPLHEDLSIAMKNSYFRSSTTFDNRQWMDIRGVGSGATGIEYVERGAHLERNVTLHEYVHLFHGMLFSDTEMRRVRALYEQAKREDRVLDYYAANNEFEYLAQAIPAYFSAQKVHPLNHKAANVKTDLLTKDPDMYVWVDSLIRKHHQYQKGDSSMLAQNWAEAYLKLAQQARLAQDSLIITYLDTALAWDSTYIPTFLAYAQHHMREEQWATAEKWLDQAEEMAPSYAPVDLVRARWYEQQMSNGNIFEETAIRAISEAYQKATEKERDRRLSAEINQQQRIFYMDYSLWQDAIETAETYLLDPPTFSTYLQDEKDETVAFLAYLKGKLGYGAESLQALAELVHRKPQNYRYQQMYGEMLLLTQQNEKAFNQLKDVKNLLEVSGSSNLGITQLWMLAKIGVGDTTAVQSMLKTPEFIRKKRRGNKMRWIEIYLMLGDTAEAHTLITSIAIPQKPYQAAMYYYNLGRLEQLYGNISEAIEAYQNCLKENPYHFKARLTLIDLYQKMDRSDEAQSLTTEGTLLPALPGPDYLSVLENGVNSGR